MLSTSIERKSTSPANPLVVNIWSKLSGVTVLRSTTTDGFAANSVRAARTAEPLASTIRPPQPSS